MRLGFQIRMVGSDRPSTPRSTQRDRDQETIWCSEFGRLQDLIAKSSGELIIERAQPVGAVAVKTVVMETSEGEFAILSGQWGPHDLIVSKHCVSAATLEGRLESSKCTGTIRPFDCRKLAEEALELTQCFETIRSCGPPLAAQYREPPLSEVSMTTVFTATAPTVAARSMISSPLLFAMRS